MSRIIGIQHRVKFSAEGEARPTRVVIQNGAETKAYELSDEQAELDFVLGRFPTSFRAFEEGEDISKILEWQLKLRKVKPGEEVPPKLLRVIERVKYRIDKVPATFDGIQSDDTVAMALGGSGDYLAFAINRVVSRGGGKVIRVAPFVLQKKRDEFGFKDKTTDAELLVTLTQREPKLFYPIVDRDAKLILVREQYQLRMDTMKARIACEQRLRQRLIGRVFTTTDGLFPEGGIEKAFDALKATDTIFIALKKEENRAIKDLTDAIEDLDVYQKVFAPIAGMGPMIAARIISAVVDIRRFATAGKFTAYCGVHVLGDGRIPRRRNSTVANWHGDCRQALYLFVDQCVKRRDSEWGKYLARMKEAYRERRPTEVVIEGKKRYTKGHIHKMAIWRTATRFAEYLYARWTELEYAGRLNPDTDEGFRQAAE